MTARPDGPVSAPIRPLARAVAAAVTVLAAAAPAACGQEGEGGSGRAAANADPPVPRHEIVVDARSTPGALRIEGTTAFPLDHGLEAPFRFSLMAAARGLALGVVAPDGSTTPVRPDSVASRGDGLGALTVWEVAIPPGSIGENVDPSGFGGASGVLELSYEYEASGTHLVFHVDEGLAFASGLNFAWHPQAGTFSGTGRLRLLTPPGWNAVAAGLRTSTPEDEARGEFAFDLPTPATWSFAVGEWDVVEDRGGSSPVRVYLSTPRRNAAAYARRSAEIIETLEREFGPYPYGEFSIVEVPATTANAAGFGGVSLEGWMIAIGPALGDELSLCFFGHEIAHQWWGNLVKSGAVGNGIMDEGLANYAGHLMVSELEGPAAASRYRKYGCPVLGWSPTALGYFAQVEAGEDTRMDQIPSSRAGAWLMDSKLYLVWVELARVLGPERMRAGLREIVRRHAEGAVSWDDVRRALSEGAGVALDEIDGFFEQWHRRTGAPELRADWSQTGSELEISITQTDPPYRLRVPLRIHGSDGAAVDTEVEIATPESVHRISVGFPVWAVDVDPDYTFLHLTPELRDQARPLGYYIRGINDDDLPSALASFDRGMEVIPSPDLQSACLLLEYGRGRTHQRHGNWDLARQHLLASLRCPSRRSDVLPTVYLRLAEIAIEVRDRDAFEWAVAAAATADEAAGRVTSAGLAALELRFPTP